MLTKSLRRGRRGEIVAFLDRVVLAFLLFSVLVGKFHTSSVTVTATRLSTDEGEASGETEPMMPPNCGVRHLGLRFPTQERYLIPNLRWLNRSMSEGKKNYELAKEAAASSGRSRKPNLSCSKQKLSQDLLTAWTFWARLFGVTLEEGSVPYRGIKMFFTEATKYALSEPRDRRQQCNGWKSRKAPQEVRDQPCNENLTDPVWNFLNQVVMCNKPKLIVCSMLQPYIESLTVPRFRSAINSD